MSADGALEKKLATYEKVNATWAEAFQNFGGSVVPQIITGAGDSRNVGAGNAFSNAMEAVGIKALRDLSLDMGLGTRQAPQPAKK